MQAEALAQERKEPLCGSLICGIMRVFAFACQKKVRSLGEGT